MTKNKSLQLTDILKSLFEDDSLKSNELDIMANQEDEVVDMNDSPEGSDSVRDIIRQEIINALRGEGYIPKKKMIKESVQFENPFELYDNTPKQKELVKIATKIIKQAIKNGKITKDNVNDNPILIKLKKLGADDTASREAIYAYIKKGLNELLFGPGPKKRAFFQQSRPGIFLRVK